MPTTIVVAEDDPTIQTVLRLGLEREGYRVVLAGDGLAALNATRAEKPSLLLLDVMMPKLTGFEVARLLRFDPQFASLPILMLTARKEELDRRTGAETGASAYLTKPFTLDELLPIVRGLLTHSRPPQGGAPHAAT